MSDNNRLPENVAETMRDVMLDILPHETVRSDDWTPSQADLITLPDKRHVKDVAEHRLKAFEFFKPARRTGTAHLADLTSLIAWANRFKSEESALFADPNMSAPKLTCIADYHAAGPIDVISPTGDPTARHRHHRAVYDFPLSNEWKAWLAISGEPLKKDDMGEFIEANAKDVMDPTPAVLKGVESDKNEPWENRLIQTAKQIEGRFGQLAQLLAMSKQFQVHETSNLTVSTNRDTGESQVQFLNEHKTADGQPLKIPNLIIITIPVFMGGAPYRMAVRFRYRKMGGEVRFIMSIYNPERVFGAALDEACAMAVEATALPLFKGKAE